ncbi:hypothetical protein [Kibdelosporangium philippinense]|uniref:hypothetical protein n=1 Tax=Kibdelosporangium philippinense TaxID=211113 RepID=UPI0024C282C8|nr:hypothetical protein [Kibdelosporangium philippinense]
MFMGGQAIYDNFTSATGAQGLADGAATMNEVVKAYHERGDRIKKIVARMDAVWKGDAAGAAQRGAGPLAVEHGLAAPAMHTAQDLATRQAGSFGDAKNAVIPVPPAPEKVDPLAAFMVPGALVTYSQQLDAHKAAAQHNVDVMRGYENASVYNMSMPQSYGQIVSDQAEIRVASPTPPPGPGEGGGSGGGGQGPGPGSGPVVPPRLPGRGGGSVQSGSGGGGSSAPGGPGGLGGGNDAGGGGGQGVTPPQHGTNPGGYVPPPTQGGGLPIGPGIPGGGGLPQGGQATGFGGGLPIGPGIPGGGGLPQGGQATGFGGGLPGVSFPLGGAGGEAGGSGGAGGRGPGVSGGPGSGAGQGPGGAGGRPGASPVAEPVAGQNAATRGGGVAGRGGGPGGMPVGAGAGKGSGGEDEEHQRASFLQEPDPDSVFGTDEVTAPPVIGGQP